MKNEIEKQAYRQGYQAGHSKGLSTAYNADRKYDEEREDRFFCAALTGLLSSPIRWQTGDKQHDTIEEYIMLASKFATAAKKERTKP